MKQFRCSAPARGEITRMIEAESREEAIEIFQRLLDEMNEIMSIKEVK
jgi:hypothetical protein